MEDAFAAYHPAVNFLFFAGAVLFGMFFTHPYFLGLSVAASALYYLLLTGRDGGKILLTMLAFAALLAFLNPFLNSGGETVLFSYSLPCGLGGGPAGSAYAGKRLYTLEALLYGAATGGVFFTMLMWFACYGQVVSGDKFLYLFAKAAPALSLLLSAVFRLAPELKRRAKLIIMARRCIGKAPEHAGGREKMNHGVAALSILTSWSLEGAVTTADSMKSRGYGSGKRSAFSLYRFGRRDLLVCLVLLFCAGLVLLAVLFGQTKMMRETDWITAAGLTGYGLFLFLPSALHIWEDVTWSILKSKI